MKIADLPLIAIVALVIRRISAIHGDLVQPMEIYKKISNNLRPVGEYVWFKQNTSEVLEFMKLLYPQCDWSLNASHITNAISICAIYSLTRIYT